MSKAFARHTIERLRPRMEHIVQGLLGEFETAGRMDLIRDFAYPLPMIVICELLGIAPEERDQFRAWTDDYFAFVGNVHADQVVDRRALQSILAASDHLVARVAYLRLNPQDDLLSALAVAEEQGDKLTMEELLANAFLLLTAGHETTTKMIGNGILSLLRNPNQLQLLRLEPSLIGKAVEEFLRYESPFQAVGRSALSDLEIGPVVVHKGEKVLLFLGAANRDPQQFEHPESLDITRHPNPHVAFGHGIHFCLGAALARLEGQIAIEAIVRQFPSLRLATSDVEWRQNYRLRHLESLHIAW